MNINKILLATALILMPLLSFSQNVEKILDEAAAKFKKYKSVKTSYLLTVTNNGKKQSSSGAYVIQGDKYVNHINGTTTWFNGKTMWTLVEDNGEVNITEPTKDELNISNPYYFLSAYKNNFTPSITGSTADSYEIKLMPKKNDSNIKSVLLRLSKINKQPIEIRVSEARSSATIHFNSFEYNNKYKNSSFSFDKSKYPNVEIVDLR